LSARILGAASPTLAEAAHHAGVAQGIAEAIENLPLHAARKQLYLPQDMLAEAGATEADVFAGRLTPQLAAAVGGLAVVAREHLGKALFLLREEKSAAVRAFLPLAAVRRVLQHESLAGSDPFKPQPLSRLRVLWAMWRATKSDAFRN
jgi:phytoene synthase